MKKLIALVLMICVGTSWGSTVRQQSIDAIARGSAFIFEGSVSGVRVVYANKRIYTLVNFEINEVISGDYAQSSIELRYLGGRIGDQALRVEEMDVPKMGEQGIYFVESLKRPGVHPLRGWGQGHFKILRNPRSDRKEVLTSTGKQVSAVITGRTDLSTTTGGKINSRIARGVVTTEEKAGPMSAVDFKEKIRGMLQ